MLFEGNLHRLETALTLIFVVSLVVLFTEFMYLACRRRMIRRLNNPAGGDQVNPLVQLSQDYVAVSKEMFYAYCVRCSHPRIDPNLRNPSANSVALSAPPPPIQMEVIDIDLAKMNGLYGPSRFLFTIKEEEKEDLESAEKDSNKKSDSRENGEKTSLEERFNAVDEPAAAEKSVVVNIDAADADSTPFSTPCASPVYLTPPASPLRDQVAV